MFHCFLPILRTVSSHLATSCRQLLGANSLVEETIASYNDVDFEVPEDILNQEFEIPSLDNE